MSTFKATPEQRSIFDYIKNEKGNLVVMARAGSGKTSTIVEALNLISWSASVTFICFNKHIQEELKRRVPKNVMVYTTHGLGYSAIMRKYKNAKFDEHKMIKIINKLGNKWNSEKIGEDHHEYYSKLLKIVNLAKQTVSLDKQSLQFLVRKYEINIDKEGKDLDRVLKLLEKSVEDTKTFDYADMIFLPATDPKIWLFPNDYVFIDECFPYEQKILTSNGNIQIGELCKMYNNNELLPTVKSWNETKKEFEYKKINKVWCNGKRDLYKVILNGKYKLISTSNHRFLTNKGWKELSQLNVGDLVMTDGISQPSIINLNDIQKDLVIGSYWGDGNLKKTSKNSYRLTVIHGINQNDYCRFKTNIINSNIELIKENGFSKKEAIRFRTKNFYFNPKDLSFDSINARSLSIMWCDDGSLINNKYDARLYSTATSYSDSLKLSKALKNKFSIESIIKKSKSKLSKKNYYYLKFNVESFKKLSNLISPYVHPSMNYKLLSEDKNKFDPNLWKNNLKDEFGLIVTKSMVQHKKNQIVFDMEVDENHNFLIVKDYFSKNENYYGIIAHNCQDLNRAQQFMINKMLKRDKLKNVTGRFIAIGDGHQCQPIGTKILMSDGTEKNIEDLNIGDSVVSYEKSKMCRFVGFYKNHRWNPNNIKTGKKVLEISKNKFNGNLIVIKSNNKLTKYTPNHRCYVRFVKTKKKSYALYLMEKDSQFRIGIHPIIGSSGDNSFKQRGHHEKAEKMWILKIYDSKFLAYLDEQYYSVEYGIPQMIFTHNQQKGNIDQNVIDTYYKRFDKTIQFNRANNLLQFFHKEYEYPFFIRNNGHTKSINNIFEIRACNIFSDYMEVIHFDENNFKLKKRNNLASPPYKIYKSTYHLIDSLEYEYYNDYVYSLKIEKYERYVADGILTHNSIQGFAGSDNKSFEWFCNRPNTKILPLTYTFRCAKNIVNKAQVIVEDIKPLPSAIDGIVRTGNALEESKDGDFILCRKSKPLLVMFFQLLLKSKKAYIKGSDLGKKLIEKANDFKTKEEMNIGLAQQLDHLRADLLDKGIFNYNDNFAFIEFKDTIDSLILLGKTVRNIDELKKMIEKIFKDDEGEGIILSTIHKSKGLEADRVFIILPDCLPYQETVVNDQGEEELEWIFPMKQTQQWMKDQELNLKYVAITRAKKELIWDEKWVDEKTSK